MNKSLSKIWSRLKPSCKTILKLSNSLMRMVLTKTSRNGLFLKSVHSFITFQDTIIILVGVYTLYASLTESAMFFDTCFQWDCCYEKLDNYKNDLENALAFLKKM